MAGRIGNLVYLYAVVEATGKTITHYERFSKKTTMKKRFVNFSDSISSKIRRDFVASRLEQTVENTATVPDLDDSPELPEGPDGKRFWFVNTSISRISFRYHRTGFQSTRQF